MLPIRTNALSKVRKIKKARGGTKSVQGYTPLSHPDLRDKPGASHTCAKEDNIYNNRVYRD
jgi:hypothetical protein